MKCNIFTSPQAFTYDEMGVREYNIMTTLKLVVLLYEQNKDISDC